MSGESHIESWTVDEVLELLSKLGLNDYADNFLENEITGDILIHLDHEALKDIGIDSVGHRLTILRAVYDTKVADGVTIEPEHFIPATAELENPAITTWNSKELLAITEALQQRGDPNLGSPQVYPDRLDDRITSAEAEIRRLTESLNRLKDQLGPVFKITKEYQPLPTPEPLLQAPSLSRKFSTKKLFLGAAPRQASLNSLPLAEHYTEPVSPSSPYKYSTDSPVSSRVPTPIHQHGRASMTESSPQTQSRLPPPPRPPPPGVMSLANRGRDRSDDGSSSAVSLSNQSTPGLSGSMMASQSPSSNAGLDAFKSFRVGFDDPCSKVLPAALKKYKINSDWRDYSLFICYGDQERSLGLDEKPLIVFQELQRLQMNPVFMLRLRNKDGPASANGTEDHERL